MRLKSKDIAEILNISPSSVSLALNNKPGVSAETRDKVNSVIEEYYSNGRLKENEEAEKASSGNIVFVIHKTYRGIIIPSQFFQNVTEIIQAKAIDAGYNLEISYYNSSIERKGFITSLKDDRIVGIILLATEMSADDLKMYDTLEKPMVVLDARFGIGDMDSVTLNNRDAMVHAVEYARDMGHREIGYLKSYIPIPNYEDRFEGYIYGLKKVGLKFREELVYGVHCSIDGAQSDFAKILKTLNIELPTVLIADIDYIAVGAMKALKEKGYEIPDQISMIGFDDISLCTQLEPKLTTLRVDNTNIGVLAVNRLIEKINGKNDYHVNIEIGTKLIKRDSVKRLIQ